MTIRDMADAYGVTLRALRFYEGRNLLRPKRQGKARLYGLRDRKRLELILKGKQLGFTLSEIRELIAKEDRSTAPALALSAAQIAAQIEHLRQQRRSLDAALRELEDARSHLQTG